MPTSANRQEGINWKRNQLPIDRTGECNLLKRQPSVKIPPRQWPMAALHSTDSQNACGCHDFSCSLQVQCHHKLNIITWRWGGGREGKLEENQSHFQPEVGNWKFTVSCIRIPADCHLRRSNWKFIIHSVYEWYGNNGTAAIGLLIYAWQYHLHITHLHMKPLHKQWMWFHRFPTSWLPLILRDPQRFLSGGGLRRMASLPASRASHRHTPHPRSNETFQVNQSMNLYQHFNGLNKKE